MATRLPGGAYTDAAWLERETRELFEQAWTLVASSDEVAAPGAFLPVRVGRYALLVVRQSDGTLRALHNTCRHRGMAIATAAGTAGERFRCSYHGWEYDLDGRLRVVPQRKTQFPDLDLEQCGLGVASVGEWGGMVFAHPDPYAPTLEHALGELPNHIGSYRPALLTQVAHAELTGNFNWKLFVENHIDVYHLWYLHETSLAAFDHTRFEHRSIGRNWVSYEPCKANEGAVPMANGHQPVGIRHLSDRDRYGIGAHMVFPNLLMASTAEFFATYAVYPIAADRSRVDLRVRAEPDADGDALLRAARSFIDEDIVACEGVQAVATSGRFAVGALARDHEQPTIAAFHRNLLTAIGKGA